MGAQMRRRRRFYARVVVTHSVRVIKNNRQTARHSTSYRDVIKVGGDVS